MTDPTPDPQSAPQPDPYAAPLHPPTQPYQQASPPPYPPPPYPPQSPPPYPPTYPPTYPYPVNPPTSGKAIASLVLGIVGLFALCAYGLGLVAAILAVVFGFLARADIRRAQGALGGDGLAKAGLVTGFVGIGLAVLGLLLVIGLLVSRGVDSGGPDSTQTSLDSGF